MKRIISLLLAFVACVGMSSAKIWTSLSEGDVIHVGDQLKLTTRCYIFESYTFDHMPNVYTLMRVDLYSEDPEDASVDTQVTENADGAYYAFKDNSGRYYFANLALASQDSRFLLPVTQTSEGLIVSIDDVALDNYFLSVYDPSAVPEIPKEDLMVTISLDGSGNVVYSQEGVVSLTTSGNVEVYYNSSYGYYCWISRTATMGMLEVAAEPGYQINRVLFNMDGDDAFQVSKEVSPFDVCLYDNGVYASSSDIGDIDYKQGNHIYEIRVLYEELVPADMTITAEQMPGTDVYYTTFFDSANQYKLPAGVLAYIGTVNRDMLFMTAIAEYTDVIPANTPVFLISGTPDFTLTLSDEQPVSFTATNDLRGVDIATGAPANCFRLNFQPFEMASEETVAGFYHYYGAIPAHSAYVVYNGEATFLPISFAEMSVGTGIDNANADVKAEKVIENGVLYIIKNGMRYNAQGKITK